ncbi:MAG: DUF262 domain-containing protein [Bacteroidales bacterium]|nr:DUF262 domain-containing protein [Bacteroidales bacterium]
MTGDTAPIKKIFGGEDEAFIIPLYQRNYAWEEGNCRQLFNDLVAIYTQNRTSHFFGSVVRRRSGISQDEWLVIDGQQRMTTISILVMAIIHCVQKNKLKVMEEMEKEDNIGSIRRTYLISAGRKTGDKQKLRPIDRDKVAFDLLLKGDEEHYVQDSTITINYNYFCNRIAESSLTFEDYVEALKRLEVIDIRLDEKDDPQLIFESLNSTGKSLSEADKIRNYLLMSLNADEQRECYEKYWNRIEEYTEYDPTMFIRDYLTIKEKSIPNIDELYFKFKDYCAKKKLTRIEMMSDMHNFAKYYYQISSCKTPYSDVNLILEHIRNIGSTVGMTFYVDFLKYAEEKNLGNKEILSVFEIVENHWARRIMCNYPANALNKLYCVLHYEVTKVFEQHEKRGVEAPSSYSDVLKYVLLKRKGSGVYPKDDELKPSFETRQVYRIPIEYRYFLFERMENGTSKEVHTDIVKGMMGDKKNNIRPSITIEHIMPQTLSQEWKNALGPDFENIHKTYLHTFANLTLTGYNSEYSNRSYEEKKKGYTDKNGTRVTGFDESVFHLSSMLKTVDKWTLDEIKRRGQQLYERFVGLWSELKSTYQPLEKEVEHIIFDEDADPTNRTISAFHYHGVKYPVSNWKNMLVSLCSLVYKDHKAEVEICCRKGDYFNTQPSEARSKFAEGCYVWASNSTITKMAAIRKLFLECDIPYSTLEFDLLPENVVDEGEE